MPGWIPAFPTDQVRELKAHGMTVRVVQRIFATKKDKQS